MSACVAERRLVLVGRKSRAELDLGVKALTLTPCRRIVLPAFTAFQPTAAPPGAGYSLAVVRRGAELILDSRGMLHLRAPSEAKLPEVSLVLTDGHIAGWTSDGQTFGRDYFLDGPASLGDERAYLDYIQPILDHWR